MPHKCFGGRYTTIKLCYKLENNVAKYYAAVANVLESGDMYIWLVLTVKIMITYIQLATWYKWYLPG